MFFLALPTTSSSTIVSTASQSQLECISMALFVKFNIHVHPSRPILLCSCRIVSRHQDQQGTLFAAPWLWHEHGVHLQFCPLRPLSQSSIERMECKCKILHLCEYVTGSFCLACQVSALLWLVALLFYLGPYLLRCEWDLGVTS